MILILKAELNQKNGGATMRVSRRNGTVFFEEMPTHQVIVDEIAEWVTSNAPLARAGVGYFWGEVGINPQGGYHIDFDLRRVVPWQSW